MICEAAWHTRAQQATQSAILTSRESAFVSSVRLDLEGCPEHGLQGHWSKDPCCSHLQRSLSRWRDQALTLTHGLLQIQSMILDQNVACCSLCCTPAGRTVLDLCAAPIDLFWALRQTLRPMCPWPAHHWQCPPAGMPRCSLHPLMQDAGQRWMFAHQLSLRCRPVRSLSTSTERLQHKFTLPYCSMGMPSSCGWGSR